MNFSTGAVVSDWSEKSDWLLEFPALSETLTATCPAEVELVLNTAFHDTELSCGLVVVAFTANTVLRLSESEISVAEYTMLDGVHAVPPFVNVIAESPLPVSCTDPYNVSSSEAFDVFTYSVPGITSVLLSPVAELLYV